MIKKGTKKLSGTYDFSTFRASNCYSKSPIRTLKKIKVKRLNEKITIQFKSAKIECQTIICKLCIGASIKK